MKEFKCDICGKEIKVEYELITLYEEFQPKEIKEVCGECFDEIRTALYKIDEALKPIKGEWLKKIIIKLKKGKQS